MEVKEFKKSIGSEREVEIISKTHLWKTFQEVANEKLFIKVDDYCKDSNCAFKFTEENKRIVLTILRYFSGSEEFNEYGVIKNTASLHKGLFISGDLGVGKSLLFEILSETGKRLFKKYGFKRMLFRTISCGNFVTLYMASTKSNTLDFDLTSFEKNKLYIDDLGVEKMAFNKYELLEQVLFERYRNNALTFITTNLDPVEVEKRYGSRIGDRLPEMCNIIIWNGNSLRDD